MPFCSAQRPGRTLPVFSSGTLHDSYFGTTTYEPAYEPACNPEHGSPDGVDTGWRNPELRFFWGHTPRPDGEIGKSSFSQWWPAGFIVDGIAYPTAEHFMMAEKARLFGDADAAARILAAKKPAQVKQIGREVRGFNETIWNDARFDIVVRGNVAKFGQHTGLRDFLLNTGENIIVEASPVDRIWGIGLAEDDPDAGNPERWKGLNLLGFALMETRDILRREAHR